MQDLAPAKPTLESGAKTIFAMLFLQGARKCLFVKAEVGSFPSPSFSLSKVQSLLGTAFSAHHHHQGEAAIRGVTSFNEATVH